MRRLLWLLLACGLSVAAYGLAFTFVAKKHFTLGLIRQLAEKRQAYISATPSPRVYILAGSAGLFSFRCEVMEPVLGRPCVNLSIGRGFGLKYDLARARRILRSGDVLVMPLEYETYSDMKASFAGGSSQGYLVQYDRAAWMALPPRERLEALFSFDVQALVAGSLEQVLRLAAFQRPFSIASFTPQGDYKDATLARVETYRERMATVSQPRPDPALLQGPTYAEERMQEFLGWARAEGVLVVGSLPTTFDDVPIDAALVDRIAHIYVDAGHAFATLPNLNQYERGCFYDSPYHLHEGCQVVHSRRFAVRLRRLLLPNAG
ncbi:MAG: hypothetical protein HY423_05215 [Candidatus Lambdaproteobacteria bacterium]|nr:hypothetical protein [Candidatus Lambdaproteobacteria bacterium]